MVKIKVKKEFTIKQLFMYLVEQKNEELLIENSAVEYDYENKYTSLNLTIDEPIRLNKKDNGIFEIEIEEEVTEETEIPLLLEIYRYSGNNSINACVFNNESIADEKDAGSIAFHMVNPDGDTTLLWTKEKGMVE